MARRTFLSYVRDDATAVTQAYQVFCEYGLQPWMDLRDIGPTTFERAIRDAITSPATGQAVLFVGPGVENSSAVRDFEAPLLVKRATAEPEFNLCVVCHGGVSVDTVAEVLGSYADRLGLRSLNLLQVGAINRTTIHQAARVLVMERFRSAAQGTNPSLRVRIATQTKPSTDPLDDSILWCDWSAFRSSSKPVPLDRWTTEFGPVVSSLQEAIGTYLPHTQIRFHAPSYSSALVALGQMFLSQHRRNVGFEQDTPWRSRPQLWSIIGRRASSGFSIRYLDGDLGASDMAVVLAVTADPSTALVNTPGLPPLRGSVIIENPSSEVPQDIRNTSEARDIAYLVQRGIRHAVSRWSSVRTTHLFLACPSGLGFLIGQVLNGIGETFCYDYVSGHGKAGSYIRGAPLGLEWPASSDC